jgi:hypothetical protein
MQAALGQPIVVDNKPGANSIIGADLVAKSPADGYSIVTVIAAHAANTTLYKDKLPFDTGEELHPFSLPAIAPLILTANNNFPAKDVEELIAYAKANPGKVNFRLLRHRRCRAPRPPSSSSRRPASTWCTSVQGDRASAARGEWPTTSRSWSTCPAR